MWRTLACIVLMISAALPMTAKDRSGDDDRIRFGRAIVVEKGTSIAGDAVCIACPIINRGAIRGDAISILGSIENRGSIDGDGVVIVGPLRNDGEVSGEATVVGGSLNLGATGVIGKDASVVIGDANITPGGVVQGKLERTPVKASAIALLFFVPLTFGVVLAIVLALICYSVAGQTRITIIAEAVRQKPGRSFVAGLAAVAVFCLALLVFAHIHPISGLLMVAAIVVLAIAAVVGYTGLSFAIGDRLRSSSPVAAVVIGAIVIAVAQAVPVLQVFFAFALLMFALGAATLTGFGTHPEWMEHHTAGSSTRGG